MGTITVAETQSSEKPKNIKVELTEENYDKAVKAHVAKGTLVSICGKLIVNKRKKSLTNVTSFKMIDPIL
ncbi:hypothetical protein [Arsenophonus nasoniae]|uniref:hypothetical protein n=1 Tax=Arsenophonus nasoniae TaxID=638 RepID=UPI00387A2DB1